MSIEAARTSEGARPDLAALEVNPGIGYIGSRILPVMRVGAKAGTYYYATLTADASAQTDRTAGSAPTSTLLSESSTTWSAAERIKRYRVPYEMCPLVGGVAGSDKLGGKASKRSVLNALETAQLAVLVDGAGTSITSAIVDGITDACDQVHRYNGKTALVLDVGIYRWLVQQTEIKNLLVRTFGGLGYVEAMSATSKALLGMLQGILPVDEVLIADDKFYPYGYRTTAAIVKLPPENDEMSFIMEPEYGRTMIYWPQEAANPFEVNSFPDDDIRSNVYDATEWDSIEQFNSGAKVLLTLNTSGSTTGA
ncbi:MAG: hypothetical protein ABFD59_08330 [Smithella sp.]